MAYSNTINNYYDSNVQATYAENISGQLLRIENAHAAIREKARELGLTIPAKKFGTSNASGTTEASLQANAKILDTAAAINNIAINRDTERTLQAGEVYRVPVGYNATPYTVTASGLGGQTDGDAIPEDILWKKVAWVNGERLEGRMQDIDEDVEAAFESYEENGVDYLALTVPTTGKYTAGNKLLSNITFNTGREIQIPVRVIHTEGEDIVDASKASFPPGYYNGTINVFAVLDETTSNKVVNISNVVKDTLTAKEGTLTIPDKYDYLASNASYKIKEGAISKTTFQITGDGTIVFSDGEVTDKGWIESGNFRPDNYTIKTAEFDVDTVTGQATVTKGGWVSKDSTTGGLSAGKAEMTGPTKASSNTTIGSTSVNKDEYYVQLETKPGYIGSSVTGINLGKVSYTLGQNSSASSNKITSPNWQVVLSKGFTEGLTIPMSVQQAVYSQVANTGAINVTTAGWIAAGTKGGLSKATITHNAVTAATSNTTINGVSVSAGVPYLKVDVSNGYVTTNDSTVIKFDKVLLDSATTTDAATTTITTKKWKVSASSGYNVAPIATVLEVQTATIDPQVAISDDYTFSIKASKAGWVDANTPIQLTIAAEEQQYALQNADLLENPSFTIEAEAGTLMKSLTIDTSIIYARLSAI